MKVGREWAKKQKKDITGDELIWGNVRQGIWGTNEWAASTSGSVVLVKLQQGADIYVEDFLNTDFDSGGSATWGSTGSVTFTAGQVAQSTSADFGNGTITQVRLISTEVSGTFLYEVTADGTNWETTTSDTLHIFINTGTDLRWRATENGASTGEISKIKLGEYH